MKLVVRTILILVAALLPISAVLGQTGSPTDDELWSHFEKWVEALPLLPPGQVSPIVDRYVADLEAMGVPKAEAQVRIKRILQLRRASLDRERIYWNGGFKLGGGPSSPLRLLQESLVKVKTGKALDSGMGRGRNAIWLASNGWEVTGYDMAQDALRSADAAARAAGVKLVTIEAKHEDFDFGENRWDLIVCAYNYMGVRVPQWPEKMLRSLRRGGIVVFQSVAPDDLTWEQVLQVWKGYRLLRLEHLDAGVVDDDWSPSRTYRTVKIVARKD